MRKKDILELKRRFKKTQCTFTKLAGCYVNSDKEKVLEFKETFLNLPDEDLFKYLEISKKVLSGGIGNNILGLEFPLDENYYNEKQNFLMNLSKSGLKNDTLLSVFYDSIIEKYENPGNYLILLFHDVYDVMTKTSDNMKLDESEEMYEYVLCAICPVTLSKPGLGYFDQEQKIKARIRDWVVDKPSLGFVYPGFVDRGSDINTLMYYTKNAKDPHPELMQDTFGCHIKTTATIQKESFESLVKDHLGTEENEVEAIYSDIQENLNIMVEEYEELYEGKDPEPVVLSKEKVKEILIDSGVDEIISEKIEASYDAVFKEEAPLVESVLDKKVLKVNEQKKVEKALQAKVESLETQLKAVQNEDTLEEDLTDDTSEETKALENEQEENFDVVLHVNPSKLEKIRTEIIDGKRCLVVPIEDDELATINGVKA